MKRANTFKKITILFSLLALLGAGCGGPNTAERLATERVTLTIWRVFDSANSFAEIMDAYRALHPNVSFEYRQLRFDEYEEELIRAFAEGKGPDIFSVHNNWINAYTSLIAPMPSTVSIPFSETRGRIKKETVYTLKEQPTLSTRALKSEYVDAVVKDVLRQVPDDTGKVREQVVALPMALDTLALYYNKELLNTADIPEPATNWTMFQEHVSKLAKIGPNDSVIQAGVAMGTSGNVERAPDILALLMMQNGVKLDTNSIAPTLAGREDKGSLAIDAVRFYTDFANPLKQVYSWNSSQQSSFESFANGHSAYFIGYAYHDSLIRAIAPKLKFSAVPVPQIEGGKTVNVANYWLETVAKSTDNKDWAWDFVLFATSEAHVTSYLNNANKPTARRSLINSQLEDERLNAFASQVLTAKSWYQGKDIAVVDKAFSELIDAFLAGDEPLSALGIAQSKISQTY